MKRNAGSPSVMTAGQINKELDALDKKDSALTDALIAAGRGYEKIQETLSKSDPLALKLRALVDRRGALRHEIERRYGPGAPRRLPSGFKPLRNPKPMKKKSTKTRAKKAAPKKRNAARLSMADVAKLGPKYRAQIEAQLGQVEKQEAKASTPKQKKAVAAKKRSLFARVRSLLSSRERAARKADKLEAKAAKYRAKSKRPTLRARAKKKVAGKAHGLVSRLLGNPKAHKAKYKIGDMVYSYQNTDRKARISHVEDRGPGYGFHYKLALKDKDGYSRSSNWIAEQSLSRKKQNPKGKGTRRNASVRWTVEGGKILADGKGQDFATYLWTLKRPQGNSIYATRKLLIDERRLPVLKRMGFGSDYNMALADLRREFGGEEEVPLILDGQSAVPSKYKAEVLKWLRLPGGNPRLADMIEAKKPNSPKRKNKTIIKAKRVVVMNRRKRNVAEIDRQYVIDMSFQSKRKPKGWLFEGLSASQWRGLARLLAKGKRLPKKYYAVGAASDIPKNASLGEAEMVARTLTEMNRKKPNPKRRNSPSSEASEQRKQFSGKNRTSDLKLFMPPSAPKEGLSTLGPLKLLVMSDGRKYKAAPGVWAVRDLRGKVWFGTSKQGGVIWNGPKEDIGSVARIDYGPMIKRHLGDRSPAIYFHKFSRPYPHLRADGQGGATLGGGAFTLGAAGIDG